MDFIYCCGRIQGSLYAGILGGYFQRVRLLSLGQISDLLPLRKWRYSSFKLNWSDNEVHTVQNVLKNED